MCLPAFLTARPALLTNASLIQNLPQTTPSPTKLPPRKNYSFTPIPIPIPSTANFSRESRRRKNRSVQGLQRSILGQLGRELLQYLTHRTSLLQEITICLKGTDDIPHRKGRYTRLDHVIQQTSSVHSRNYATYLNPRNLMLNKMHQKPIADLSAPVLQQLQHRRLRSFQGHYARAFKRTT